MNHAYLHAACFTTHLHATWPDVYRELFGGQNCDMTLRDQVVVARAVCVAALACWGSGAVPNRWRHRLLQINGYSATEPQHHDNVELSGQNFKTWDFF